MKISDIKGKTIEDLNYIKETTKKEKTLKSELTQSNEKVGSQTEKVEFSSKSLIEYAIKKISLLPETREEKVSKIKAQIQAGTYKVSNKEIARALISSILNEIA